MTFVTTLKRLQKTLHTQRWDDHRYYHQSRINQALHLASALSFLVAYVFLFIDPVISAMVAWLVAMTTRQIGHFFFESKEYDTVNHATFEFKEAIKVGYNLNRKIVLLSIWAAIPALAYWYPETVTWMVPASYENTTLRIVGFAWLMLGVAGLLFRALQLTIKEDLFEAFAWVLKILTDPFHDIKLYHRAPLYLMKGELIDPMDHVRAS
jgi:F0F1-type ATP synthase assembly protein I